MKLQSFYIEPNTIPVQALIEALNYWDEKRGERIAPAWPEISLFDFDVSIIPFINVVDISENSSKSRVRFWGTGLTEIFGRDFTNCNLEEFPIENIGHSATLGYEKLAREKIPNCEVREFRRTSGVVGRQIVLRLPLSDDGKNIQHGLVIHFHEFDEKNLSLKEFYRDVFSETGQ